MSETVSLTKGSTALASEVDGAVSPAELLRLSCEESCAGVIRTAIQRFDNIP